MSVSRTWLYAVGLAAIALAGASFRALAVDPPKPDAAKTAQTKPGAGGDAAKPHAAMVIEEGPSAPEAPPPPPQGEEKSAIATYIREQTSEVVRCYQKRLDDKPTLQGKLYVIFYIGPAGRVIGATTSGLEDRDLASCILPIVRKWEFEKPKSGGKLMVKYPFVFTPRPTR
jgi:hypothetical protein